MPFVIHLVQSGITKIMMENSLMIPDVMDGILLNLKPFMKMVCSVSSSPAIYPSIQMGGSSSFLRTNIPMHGKHLYLLLYALVLWLMGAGPFRRRWAIGLVRSHRLRWHPPSG